MDLIITQTESMSGYFLLEDKYKYKSLLQVCIHFDFSYKLKHARNVHLMLQILSLIQLIRKNQTLKSYHCHHKSHLARPTQPDRWMNEAAQ